MGAVSYTAKRSLLAHHVADAVYGLDVDLMDARRARQVEKDVHRATGGRTETLYHRADTVWDFTFAPVSGDMVAALREFLDSTASGESFLLWAYGTEEAPLTLKRTDSGYRADPLLRTGGRDLDWYTMRINAREVTA